MRSSSARNGQRRSSPKRRKTVPVGGAFSIPSRNWRSTLYSICRPKRRQQYRPNIPSKREAKVVGSGDIRDFPPHGGGSREWDQRHRCRAGISATIAGRNVVQFDIFL